MYRSFYQKRIKATILFATETGRARNYANVVKDVFGRVFAAKVCCMDEYDKTNLENEQLLIVVTSTFGSGDPPANGEVSYTVRHAGVKLMPVAVKQWLVNVAGITDTNTPWLIPTG